jgi:hypothetical protein
VSKTATMSQEEYQDHMDKLAMRISDTASGEGLEDSLSAFAACIGFGMAQLPREQHEKMRAHLNRIIDVIIENVAKNGRPQVEIDSR